MNSFYVSLSDHKVLLEPLSENHISEMLKICHDPDIWTWYTLDLSEPEALTKWMNALLEESILGTKMSYAVLRADTHEVIGSTSFGHIDWEEFDIEIGWTWLSQEHIGAGINKHMKYLMLRHAFETMGIQRLELRTDERNARSRKAIEKIGAKYDGMLRYHRATQGNRRRNTVVYSIIQPEWDMIRSTIFKDFD